MSDIASVETGKRRSGKLYSEEIYGEEQERQTSNGPGVAGFVEPELEIVETKAAPRPWRLSSARQVPEEADVAACPWRVQPHRRQQRRTKEVQKTALDLAGMVEEAAS